MKPVGILVVVCSLGLLPPVFGASAAFTYQGRLNDQGKPANGNYDFRFTLYDALAGGNAVGGPATNLAVNASSGLFTALLDFGGGPFSSGAPRWLQIEVRTNTSTGPFIALAPRQALTTTPYSITASNLSGTFDAGQLTGTLPAGAPNGTYSGAVVFNNPNDRFAGSFSGNGGSLTNLNGAGVQPGSIGLSMLSPNVQNALSAASATNSGQTLTNLPMPGYVWQFQRTPLQRMRAWFFDRCAPSSGWGWYPQGVMTEITNLASKPLQVAAGWDLITIDDGWEATNRDVNGDLTWNPATFTNSIPALIDMAHTNGLRVSLYTAAAATTCCGFPGSTLDTLYRDVRKFMSWGCDMIRSDQCGGQPYLTPDGLRQVLRIVNQAIADYNNILPSGSLKRGMVVYLVLNDGGALSVALAEAAYESNVIPIYGGWSNDQSLAGDLASIRRVFGLAALIGPGHSGPVYAQGNGYPPTPNEVSLAAMACCGMAVSTAPDPPNREASVNPEAYAILRDPLQRVASIVWSNSQNEVWVKALEGNDLRAVALINANPSSQNITLTPQMLGANSATVFNVRDVWNHANLAPSIW